MVVRYARETDCGWSDNNKTDLEPMSWHQTTDSLSSWCEWSTVSNITKRFWEVSITNWLLIMKLTRTEHIFNRCFCLMVLPIRQTDLADTDRRNVHIKLWEVFSIEQLDLILAWPFDLVTDFILHCHFQAQNVSSTNLFLLSLFAPSSVISLASWLSYRFLARIVIFIVVKVTSFIFLVSES